MSVSESDIKDREKILYRVGPLTELLTILGTENQVILANK